MNTEIIVHPKLQHYGLTTANLDAMIDWYQKVLGMAVNHRASLPPVAQGRASFSSFPSSATTRSTIVLYFSKHQVRRSIRINSVTFACNTSPSNTRPLTICSAPTLVSKAWAFCR